jgi:hypothetical protein
MGMARYILPWTSHPGGGITRCVTRSEEQTYVWKTALHPEDCWHQQQVQGDTINIMIKIASFFHIKFFLQMQTEFLDVGEKNSSQNMLFISIEVRYFQPHISNVYRYCNNL